MKRAWFALVLLLGPWTAWADGITFFPTPRHQQYQTFGLFDEEQSGIIFASGGNAARADLGTDVTLLEASSLPFHPQLTVYGSVDTSFLKKSNAIFDFVAETFDAEFGFAIESELTPSMRLSVGLTHISGHAGDGIPDPSLFGPNLGDDELPIRLIYDVNTSFRFGFTFKPLLDWDPHNQWFGADQFVEWMPLGQSPSHIRFNPYIAMGLDEKGNDGVGLTYHVQVGIFAGNHYLPERDPTVRIALGYYSGWDPRMKYAQFLLAKAQFFYFAVLVNV